MAFGRGDWMGQGLGNSVQKLEYLPGSTYRFLCLLYWLKS
ncbi:hypothetical protein O9992_11765 [Vibrio lentus]|nr:hypothetical protein [Vibrio lentus]